VSHDRGAGQTHQASARGTRRLLRAANVADAPAERIIDKLHHGNTVVLAEVARGPLSRPKRDSRGWLPPRDPARRANWRRRLTATGLRVARQIATANVRPAADSVAAMGFHGGSRRRQRATHQHLAAI
jgi:hypothetical protein